MKRWSTGTYYLQEAHSDEKHRWRSLPSPTVRAAPMWTRMSICGLVALEVLSW